MPTWPCVGCKGSVHCIQLQAIGRRLAFMYHIAFQTSLQAVTASRFCTSRTDSREHGRKPWLWCQKGMEPDGRGDDCRSAGGSSPCRLCLLASEFYISMYSLITMPCMRTMYNLHEEHCLNCGNLQTGDNLYIPVPHAATCPKCLVKWLRGLYLSGAIRENMYNYKYNKE